MKLSFSQSRIAAKLQEVVSQRREEAGLYREIAEQISLPDSGRVLDMGTGTGFMGYLLDLVVTVVLFIVQQLVGPCRCSTPGKALSQSHRSESACQRQAEPIG